MAKQEISTVSMDAMGTVYARLVGTIRRNPGLKKITANVGWLSLDRGLRLVNGLLVGAWMARYLGPADFGQLSYCFAFVAMFSPLLKLGIEKFAVHDLVQHPERRDSILGTSAALLSIGALVASASAVTLIAWLRPGDVSMRQMVIVRSLIGFFQVSLVIDLWFQSQVASKWTVMATTLGTAINGTLRMAFILMEAPLLWFVYVGVVEAALVAAVLCGWYRYTMDAASRWKLDRQLALGMVMKSWPFILSGVAVAIYMKVDQVMLGSFRDDTELGRYSVAVRITELAYLVPTILASSIFPALIRLKNANDAKQYRHRLQQFFDLNATAAFACIMMALVGGGVLVTTLFGDRYAASIPLLSVLIWACIPTFLGVARSHYLVNHSLAKYQLLSSCVGLLANVALNLILIPRFGGFGAALATVSSQTLAAIGMSLLVPSLREIGVMQCKSVLLIFRLPALLRDSRLQRNDTGTV